MSILNATTVKTNTIQNTSGVNAITIDSTGRVLNPQVPYIIIDGNNGGYFTFTDQQAWVSTYTSIQNVGGGMSLNQSNGQLTVPLTGVYFITCQMYVIGSDPGRTYIRKNGGEVLLSEDSSGNDHTQTLSTLVYANAGDYFQHHLGQFNNQRVFMGATHYRASMFYIGG